MTISELMINGLAIIGLIVIIRFPGYFKIWGVGYGGKNPYPKGSPEFLYIRLLSLLALIVLLIFDLVLGLRELGIKEIDLFIEYIGNYMDMLNPFNVINRNFVVVSLINCFWMLWYLYRIKDCHCSCVYRWGLGALASFFLLTFIMIRISFIMQWICIFMNSVSIIVIYSGYFEKILLECIHNGRKESK